MLQEVSVVSSSSLFSCDNKKNGSEVSLFPRQGREGEEVGDGRRRECLAAGGGSDHHYHHCNSSVEARLSLGENAKMKLMFYL